MALFLHLLACSTTLENESQLNGSATFCRPGLRGNEVTPCGESSRRREEEV
jgi:hypothetical protein